MTEEVGRIHGVAPGYKPKLEEALNFYAPESRPAVEAVVKKAAETGEPYDLESLFIPSGSKDKIWVRSLGRVVYSGGKIVKLVGTFQNIDKHKRAEEAVRESEAHFRIALENAPIVVFDQDRELRYVWIYNPHPGFDRQAVLGKTDAELLPADEAARLTEIKRRVLETGVTALEEVRTTIGGQSFFYDLTVEPLRDLSGNIFGVTCASFDITERKQAEEVLARERNLLRTLMDNLPDKVYIKDAECRYVINNPVHLRSLGVTQQEEVLGKTSFDFFPQPLAAQYYADEQAVIRSGQPLIEKEEVVADLPTGQPAWHLTTKVPLRDSQGKVIGLLGVSRNITERKRAEAAEREQRMLAEALRDAAAALNSTLNFDAVLDCILDNVGRVVPCDATNIMLVESGVAGVVRSRGASKRELETTLVGLRFLVADLSGLRQMTETRQPLLISDTQAYPGWADVPATRWIRSYVGVPILAKGQVIGFLNFDSATPGFFAATHAAPLQAFADQAAIAIQNARLFEERDRKVRELTALNEIATSITSTLDLERVLDLTMQQIQDVLGVQVCSLMLLDEQTQELTFKVSLGPGAEQAKEMRLGVNQGIAGWVAREGKPDLVLDVRTDPRWYPDVDSHTGFATRSILAVPMKSKEKVIGVIEAINKVHSAFSADDLQLLNSISMVVTTAIENARLFGELNKAYWETMKNRAQILESRNTLRALFDGINDSVCIIDQDLRITAINRTAAAVVGKEPQDLVGGDCRVVLCQSTSLCDDCPVTSAFRTGKPASSIGQRIQRQGAMRELEASTFLLQDAAGVVDRVIYFAQDVTEKRKMEATLLQSARLSAVGELTAGITHEIGNPLTAVIGNAQMLLEGLEPSDPRHKMAQLIERAGSRMERLVNNLLKFSRQEDYSFEPTDLNASIEDALSLVAYQLERDNIHVTKEFQANLPLISTSASHLQTVWMNLLLNARDAIPKGKTGQIQIATRISKDRRSIEALFIDNGSGITPEALSRIFDPFFTTKPQGKGTGLGLYISNVVIAHHHGTLQVQSQEGKGSTFVVTVPFESEAQADDAELSAA